MHIQCEFLQGKWGRGGGGGGEGNEWGGTSAKNVTVPSWLLQDISILTWYLNAITFFSFYKTITLKAVTLCENLLAACGNLTLASQKFVRFPWISCGHFCPLSDLPHPLPFLARYCTLVFPLSSKTTSSKTNFNWLIWNSQHLVHVFRAKNKKNMIYNILNLQ